MPVSPLGVASMLACARIGAIHRFVVHRNLRSATLALFKQANLLDNRNFYISSIDSPSMNLSIRIGWRTKYCVSKCEVDKC